jgi:hypothetical protein
MRRGKQNLYHLPKSLKYNLRVISDNYIKIRELGKPIDIKDWDFAFSIDISSINMDPNSPEYDAVKNVIHQPGDYSITRLYLDFNSRSSCPLRFGEKGLSNCVYSRQDCEF